MSRTVLITGASRGIGAEMCRRFVNEGFNIIGVSRSMEFSNDLIVLAKNKGLRLLGIKEDISNSEGHQRIYDQVKETFGTIDVLINNAGVAPEKRTDVLEMSMDSYERVMKINLFGPVFLTQKLYPLLKQEEPSSIIFITSISAEVASVDRAEYCLSKSALSMFSKLMAIRLASESIGVYEIRPGVIDTDMIKPVKEKYDTLVENGFFPMGRLGQPEDIAKAALLLAKGDLGYAQGAIIEISGGMQIRSL